jgi:hypothetical protein
MTGVPPSVTVSSGYTLGQMVQRVRQVLRPGPSRFRNPSYGPQGFQLVQLRDRVRTFLRDDNVATQFITDDEINGWLNEALQEVTWRTKMNSVTVTGTLDASGNAPVPTDYLTWQEMLVDGKPANLVTDDEEWNDLRDSEGSENRVMVRINGRMIETNLAQMGVAYTLTYVKQPSQLVLDTDQPSLPVNLQQRLLHYARAQGLYKERDFFSADRYMQLFESGLAPAEGLAPSEVVRQGEMTYRDIQDYEIVDWLNEGLLDLAFRLGVVKHEIIGNIDTDGRFQLPADYLRAIQLRTSAMGSDGRFDVEFVDDAIFTDWLVNSGGGIPAHYIGRIFEGYVELYPAPTGNFTLRYVARPNTLVEKDDTSDLPVSVQERAIHYARAHALMAQGLQQDLIKADRYMALYSSDLPSATVRDADHPGPLQLVPAAGWFDADPEAHHQG